MAKTKKIKSRSLTDVLTEAITISKNAKRNNKSLSGDNYYANKFFQLKLEGGTLFSSLNTSSVGEVSAIGEIVDKIFDTQTNNKEKLLLYREVEERIRKESLQSVESLPVPVTTIIPIALLSKRGYMQRIGYEINGCYSSQQYTACLVMMRRLLEVAIIDLFEMRGLTANIKDASGNYFFLDDLIKKTLSETSWTLSRNSKQHLPNLKAIGDLAAHGKHFHGKVEDVDRYSLPFRSVIEELLTHAGLT